VDELAADFAGVGVPLTTDGPGVLRVLPEVAEVPTLEPGVVVRPQGRVRHPGSVVFGLALRGLAGAGAGRVSATGVDVAGRTVPLEKGRLRIRWDSGLDDSDDTAVVPAGRALGLAGPVKDLIPAGTWSGKIVLVGTVDPAQTPYYDTPIGPLPELFIQANALNTLLTGEYLLPAPPWVGVLVVLAAVLGVAGLWSRRWWWGSWPGCSSAVDGSR
jgi:hypothetical protein